MFSAASRLRFGHTPLDPRWRVSRVTGSRRSPPLSRRAAQQGEIERLEAVNRYVNGRVRFVDDSRQYGRADVWAAASDTLRRGRGDCEDYAIAKLQMLRAPASPTATSIW